MKLPLDLPKSVESVINFLNEADLEREAPSFSSVLSLSLPTPMTMPIGGGL